MIGIGDGYDAESNVQCISINATNVPFPYAQLSKVGKTDLEFSDSLRSRDVVFGVSSLSLLLYFAHLCGQVLLSLLMLSNGRLRGYQELKVKYGLGSTAVKN